MLGVRKLDGGRVLVPGPLATAVATAELLQEMMTVSDTEPPQPPHVRAAAARLFCHAHVLHDCLGRVRASKPRTDSLIELGVSGLLPTPWPPAGKSIRMADAAGKKSFEETPADMRRTETFFTEKFPTIISNGYAPRWRGPGTGGRASLSLAHTDGASGGFAQCDRRQRARYRTARESCVLQL
jgi:hypothetical protein